MDESIKALREVVKSVLAEEDYVAKQTERLAQHRKLIAQLRAQAASLSIANDKRVFRIGKRAVLVERFAYGSGADVHISDVVVT
ncbi:MAG: hypothetical protein PHH26_08185 [Candidatus Thermoplasmatota archaeon]|nr:hypothetical protein [Candidatus Thermoplasmatota archaeon]